MSVPGASVEGAGTPPQSVRAVERALDILLLFSDVRTEMGISDIARELGLSKSTVHRLLIALRSKGFVQQNEDNQRYSLGLTLMHLGRVVVKAAALGPLALPTMRRLQAETGETVNLNIRRGLHRICIETVESRHDVRHFVEIGKELPLHSGASGKVLMAHMPEGEVRRLLGSVPCDEAAEDDRIGSFLQELALVRARGYAESTGERVDGATSISAPIRNHLGVVIASLTVSGPAVRFTREQTQKHLQRLLSAAEEVSTALGGSSFGGGAGVRKQATCSRPGSM